MTEAIKTIINNNYVKSCPHVTSRILSKDPLTLPLVNHGLFFMINIIVIIEAARIGVTTPKENLRMLRNL